MHPARTRAQGRLRAACGYHVDLSTDEIGRQVRKPLSFSFGVQKVDSEIFPLDPSELVKSSLES